jgi:hypothetical protein
MKYFIFLIVIFFFTQCALFEKKNLRLIYAVEDHLVPEDKTLKVVTAPLYIPVGLVGGVLDVFLIHPLAVIPDSVEDTIETVWIPHEKPGYVTRMGSIPFLTLLTPIYFTLSWTNHWLFKSSDDYERSKPTAKLEPEIWVKEFSEKVTKLDTLDANPNETVDMASIDLNLHLGECYDYVDLVNLSKPLETILKWKSIPGHYEFKNSVINCMIGSEKYWNQYEDVLLSILYTEKTDLALLLNPLIQKKSEKGSAFILNKIFDSSSTEEEIRELIYALYAIDNKKDLARFKSKLHFKQR